MRHFDIDFLFFFKFFDLVFFANGFPNSLIIRSSFFCLVNENLNCTSGLALLCFFVSSSDALFFVLHLFTTQS